MKTTASEKTAAVMGRIKSSYPRIQHILVPLDFSGKSRQALRYAVPLAEKFAAVVHLVHVLPPPTKSEQADLPRRKHAAIKRLGDMAALLPHDDTVVLVLPPMSPTFPMEIEGPELGAPDVSVGAAAG